MLTSLTITLGIILAVAPTPWFCWQGPAPTTETPQLQPALLAQHQLPPPTTWQPRGHHLVLRLDPEDSSWERVLDEQLAAVNAAEEAFDDQRAAALLLALIDQLMNRPGVLPVVVARLPELLIRAGSIYLAAGDEGMASGMLQRLTVVAPAYRLDPDRHAPKVRTLHEQALATLRTVSLTLAGGDLHAGESLYIDGRPHLPGPPLSLPAGTHRLQWRTPAGQAGSLTTAVDSNAILWLPGQGVDASQFSPGLPRCATPEAWALTASRAAPQSRLLVGVPTSDRELREALVHDAGITWRTLTIDEPRPWPMLPTIAAAAGAAAMIAGLALAARAARLHRELEDLAPGQPAKYQELSDSLSATSTTADGLAGGGGALLVAGGLWFYLEF